MTRSHEELPSDPHPTSPTSPCRRFQRLAPPSERGALSGLGGGLQTRPRRGCLRRYLVAGPQAGGGLEGLGHRATVDDPGAGPVALPIGRERVVGGKDVPETAREALFCDPSHPGRCPALVAARQCTGGTRMEDPSTPGVRYRIGAPGHRQMVRVLVTSGRLPPFPSASRSPGRGFRR